MVVIKSSSHPDLLVYAEGRVIKAIEDEKQNCSESSLEFSADHRNEGGKTVNNKQLEQQEGKQPYDSSKATNMEKSFIISILSSLLVTKKLSLNASDNDLWQLRETHEDILAWISLDDLQQCYQEALIKVIDKDNKEQQQQPQEHGVKVTSLEKSFIGSLLESGDLELPSSSDSNVTDDDLQRMKEVHEDILYWISLEDLRLCYHYHQHQQASLIKVTPLEMSLIGSLLWKQLQLTKHECCELPTANNVTDDDLQKAKDEHEDILSWISLEDLRLCLNYNE